MKKLKILLIAMCVIAPALVFSQTVENKKSSSDTTQGKRAYKKRSYTRTTTKTAVDTIRKENAPILGDNGNENTTGIVDGSRSSTGRPDADTMVNYSVKKSRIRTKNPDNAADTTKRRKRQQ